MSAPALQVHLAAGLDDLRRAWPVMAQLRAGLTEAAFVDQVQRQMQQGYRLALGTVDAEVVVVAGFVIGEKLAWGRHLYVDDLVTDAERRSGGAGAAMLDWLRVHAREMGCAELHLDSGRARIDAHRFYLAQGMEDASRHFRMHLDAAATEADTEEAWLDPSHEGGLDDGRLE